MAKETDDTIVKVAVVVGGIFVVKSFLDNFLSPGSQLIEDVQTTPPNDNPFSVFYGPYTEIWGDRFFGYPGGEVAYWKNHKDSFYIGNDLDDYSMSGDSFDIVYLGELLYDSFDWWSSNDLDTIFKAFSLMQSKVTVAAVASYLAAVYNIDLFLRMKNGDPRIPFNLNGLSSSAMADIISKVNSLPVTVPGD